MVLRKKKQVNGSVQLLSKFCIDTYLHTECHLHCNQAFGITEPVVEIFVAENKMFKGCPNLCPIQVIAYLIMITCPYNVYP